MRKISSQKEEKEIFLVKQGGTIFKVFGVTRPGIGPRSPGPLANTLPSKPIRSFQVF